MAEQILMDAGVSETSHLEQWGKIITSIRNQKRTYIFDDVNTSTRYVKQRRYGRFYFRKLNADDHMPSCILVRIEKNMDTTIVRIEFCFFTNEMSPFSESKWLTISFDEDMSWLSETDVFLVARHLLKPEP